MLYSVGGFGNLNQTPSSNLTAYNATSQSWSNVTAQGGNFNFFPRNFASTAASSTSGLGLGFLSGGLETKPNSPQGMVRFDASNPAAPSWKNETYAPRLVGATMQYVRFGNKGVLVAIGGYVGVCPPRI